MQLLYSGQVSVADVTDSYSAVLNPDNYTFKGTATTVRGTQTVTVKPVVVQGSLTIPAEVDLTNVTPPTGITITKNASGAAVIKATSAVTDGGMIEIPIVVHDSEGDITFVRVFSYSIAYAGEDAINVRIDSSAGNIFKNNIISTVLTCRVFQGDDDITGDATAFKWIKKDQWGNVDESWTKTIAGNAITITNADVLSKAIFECEVTLP